MGNENAKTVHTLAPSVGPFRRQTQPPKLPGYALTERLGQGGMGTVYLARQEKLNREVAVKFLSFWLLDDDEMYERFLRETELLARVIDPNVVTVHDAGVAQGWPYYVMEYVPGGSLSDLIREGPLSPSKAWDVIRQAGSALSAIHAQGVLHRDLKPGNILIRDGRRVKVADFGISALKSQLGQLTGPGEAFGTGGYMAPEQARGLPVNERADIYSFAVVAREALTGKRGGGETRREADSAAPTRKLPAAVSAVLDRATAPDPDARHANVEAFLKDLKSALKASSRRRTAAPDAATRRPADVQEPASPRKKARRAVWAAALAGLAGISLTAALMWPGGVDRPADPPPPGQAVHGGPPPPHRPPPNWPGGKWEPKWPPKGPPGRPPHRHHRRKKHHRRGPAG